MRQRVGRICSTLGILLVAVQAWAAPVWLKHTTDANFNHPSAVTAADVDGDGRTDILAASDTDGLLKWWKNVTPDSFVSNTIDASFTSALDIRAVNLDGTNGMDVLAAGGSVVAWYENDGSQSFSKHVIAPGLTGVQKALAVNLDGDADLDVLAVATTSFGWFQNNGSMVFSGAMIDSLSDGRDIDVSDLNGDDAIDIVVTDNSAVAWYRNNGAASFAPNTVTANFGTTVDAVFAKDMDNDGDTDVVAGGSNRVIWYENNGSGVFTAHPVDLEVSSLMDMVSVDLNQDGRWDILAACNDTEPSVVWWENQGNGNFTRHTIQTDYESLAVGAGDFNGDGRMDPLAGWQADDDIAYWNLTTIPDLAPAATMHDVSTYTSLLPAGDRLYLGKTFLAQIDICDISERLHPRIIGGYDQLGGDSFNPARWLALSGQYLMVSNVEEDLFQILDVSNPAAPVKVNEWDLGYDAGGIAVQGNLAYVVDSACQLHVMNIADPAGLTQVAVKDFGSGQLSDIEIQGQYAYIANRSGYLMVVDLSAPTAPALAAAVTTTAQAQAMELALNGNYAYLTTVYEGLLTVDISDPLHPAVVHRFTPTGFGIGVDVQGNRLVFGTASRWYAETDIGVYLMDLSNPAQPTPISCYTYHAEVADNTNDGFHQVVFDGDFIYAAHWGTGLDVFLLNSPVSGISVEKSVEDVLASPNPARNTVRFVFNESPDKAKVEVYNLSGERVVKVAADNPGTSLTMAVGDLAPGMYLYRTILTVNGEEKKLKVKKLVIVK